MKKRRNKKKTDWYAGRNPHLRHFGILHDSDVVYVTGKNAGNKIREDKACHSVGMRGEEESRTEVEWK